MLPFVWHCVVLGETLVHCGAAALMGAARRAMHIAAAAAATHRTELVMTYSDRWSKSTSEQRPGILSDQIRSENEELVVPREHAVTGLRRGGVDLDVAFRGAVGGLAALDGAAAGHLALREQMRFLRVDGLGAGQRRQADRRRGTTDEQATGKRAHAKFHLWVLLEVVTGQRTTLCP
ncbi:hypothetical protein MSMEG_5585 [Mycolicibacterium smegmatis MC2 155]|uniref:Uncharacterized protein n=1 Tax=Mycolicibacterium smegmatis (strain ATCC 700084 / mc(2)155) TaxID=246196 RepID=A0R3T3_MYCS2|nr:hypothetical protein MSMEG_5585 [Mycolicibacterium smegmatis MC2 155]